ncbi:MAG: PrsW family glutamic-type intramembrane protease [Clostridium sp.]|nr:PrsW family glutamic-type intramembrane protease [Clostridium sp.]
MDDYILPAILIGMLPAVLLVAFIYWRDKYQREPWQWIFKAFRYGMLSAVAAIVIEMLLPQPENSTLLNSAYNAFVVASIPEECMKLLFFWLLVRRNPFFDEHMDGVVYACCVSMGFAGVENVLYMLGNIDNLASIALTRALLSVPGHFFFNVFTGFYYSLAVFGNPAHKAHNLTLALLVPILLHGAFDFGLFSMNVSPGWALPAFVLFLLVCRYNWKYGRRRIHTLLNMDKQRMDGDGVLHTETESPVDSR